MPGKRYSTELSVAKLREAERFTGRREHPVVCKKLAISEQTFHRSRRGRVARRAPGGR